MRIRVDVRESKGLRKAFRLFGDRPAAGGGLVEAVLEAGVEYANMVHGLAFRTETDPVTGSRWKPLSAATKARRGVDARILQDTGVLRTSVDSPNAPAHIERISGKVAEVGTDLVYAAAHQEGLGVPRRRFVGMGDADEAELADEVGKLLDRMWEGADA